MIIMGLWEIMAFFISIRSSIAFLAVGVSSALTFAEANSGTATINVELENPGTPVNFTFSGNPSGTVLPGQSIVEDNLIPGVYTATESSGSPGFELVSINCDDNDSNGNTNTRTTRFNIGNGEAVSCIYLYRKKEQESEGTSSNIPPLPVTPGDPVEPPGSPPSSQPTPDVLQETSDCEPPALVPNQGKWMISNLPGSMVCGSMNIPLTPSSEPGTLQVLDCGRTVIGSGMTDDTAELTMHAVDSGSGRYTGSVGGEQDGIPMTIEFEWDVQSEAFITGSLHSEVSTQGMTCIMSRSYEMRFTGD